MICEIVLFEKYIYMANYILIDYRTAPKQKSKQNHKSSVCE